MKKFIITSVFCLLACVISYMALVFIWGEYVPGFRRPNLITIENNNTHAALQEVANYKDIDILFLGSSRAYATFDVRTYQNMGLSVFNLGTSSQTPMQTNLLLKRYLDKLNPKLVIYEVSPRMLAMDGVESATDIIANSCLGWCSVSMAMRLNNIKVYNGLIYRLFVDVLKKDPIFSGNIDEENRTYIKGGYVDVNLLDYSPRKEVTGSVSTELNKIQITYLSEISDMLKRKGIKLILVQVPYVRSEYELYDNVSFGQLISGYGEYCDFNKNADLMDVKYFRDNLHLNRLGVKVFNKELIDQLGLKKLSDRKFNEGKRNK